MRKPEPEVKIAKAKHQMTNKAQWPKIQSSVAVTFVGGLIWMETLSKRRVTQSEWEKMNIEHPGARQSLGRWNSRRNVA